MCRMGPTGSSSLLGSCLLSLIVLKRASSASECESDTLSERKFGDALLQVKQSFQRASLSSGSFGVGNEANLTVEGFELVRSECCITEMAQFIKRWIESTGRTICHTGGLFGLSWWYDCEEDDVFKNVTTHFASLIGEDGVGPGSPAEIGPCPWIASDMEACEPMPDKCQGNATELPDCKTSTSTTPSTIPPSTLPTTTSSTTPDRCLPEDVNLDFAKSTLTENNLGGTGPWLDNSSNEIRYSGVGTIGGMPIDLVISVKDGTYYQSEAERSPGVRKESNGFNCENIGINGGHDTSCTTGAHFGQINLRAEEDFDEDNYKTLLFRFEDTSKNNIILEGFYFTIFDIDERKQKKVREFYRISGWDKVVYDTDPNTAEAWFKLEDPDMDGVMDTLFMKSTMVGDGCDNPTDPMQLEGILCNGRQVNRMKRSAMFLFKNQGQFEVKVRVPCGTPANPVTPKSVCDGDGRNFLFSFKSAMADICL